MSNQIFSEPISEILFLTKHLTNVGRLFYEITKEKNQEQEDDYEELFS